VKERNMQFRLINRTARNQADLKADSGTVRYDVDMLIEAAGRCVEAERRKDVVGMNMAVESFAIHCRAVIQFLFGHLEWIERPGPVQERFPPPRPTDVFAHDYYADWRHDCPAPSQMLGDSKWRADKHVAHLTTDRRGINQEGTGIESVWDIRACVNELGTVMALFLARAPAANFDTEELRKMRARLAPWIAPPTKLGPASPFVARSSSLDGALAAVKLTAKTDARTTAVPPAFYPHGMTE
jgi:hypothetical protein